MAIDHFRISKFTTVDIAYQRHMSALLSAMQSEDDDAKRVEYHARYEELKSMKTPYQYPDWLATHGPVGMAK